MADRVTRENLSDLLRAALPEVRGTLRVPGLTGRSEVWRDRLGIPHVRAGSTADAFFAQGFIHAQDRLWHMEYDRRRACGRWAEYAGDAALAQDTHLRRLRLEASARADYAHVNAETRAMLDAYAAGVNAFIRTTPALPAEYALVDGRPEPWEPWQSLAVFKVRHADMGVWQMKAWRARLLRRLGAARTAQLCPGTQPNPMLIVPPGVEYAGPATDGLKELTEAEAVLARLPDWEQGSNNWAVAGHRTASGKPLVAGDPHRALETPNVYYQNHLACPEFDAIGLSFPGVPGFPHFGHNPHVAWCVTHTSADYQDLYIERFDPADATRYEFRGEWRPATVTRETIHVRGAAAPVEVRVTETHHGPVILGDPTSGHAVTFRYTATAEPNPTFEAFLPMLRARSAGELEAAMRPWVDPVNNLVFADVHGAIGYRTRGRVPVRAMANAWLPVPGWDGAHEWEGAIPFEEMPAMRDPEAGFVATANSRVAGAAYPHYIHIDFAPDFRTRRVVERLRGLPRATAADMAAIHADRVSIPARDLVEILKTVALPGVRSDARAQGALDRLLAWDGVMDRDGVAPTIYAVFRERLMRDLMAPVLGPLTTEAFAGAPRGAVTHMARLRARLAEWIRKDDRSLLAPGTDWPTMLARALSAAAAELEATLGPDPAAWRWGAIHATQPRHTLAAGRPDLADLLNPPSVPMGGDGDTVQAASFISGSGYGLTATAVARYVFDLGDWERSAWAVPLGVSGHPGSPHFADQAPVWGEVALVPMTYDWARVQAEADSHQVLDPA